MDVYQPGPIAFLGSGETAPGAQSSYDLLLRQARLSPPVRIAVLETPAGFEPNSPRVAGRVAHYLRDHLPNWRPEITVVPARRRGTPYSPDDATIARLLRDADVIMAGPGSPTYAVRQLRGSLVWDTMRARHRLGAGVILASAAVIAAGAWALPVYEIYKAGLDLHWQPGLDLLADLGLGVVFVPHWNNREGGSELDTSRCFMGRERFAQLLRLLPPDTTVVGIDEHTTLLLQCGDALCQVAGAGGVTILRGATGERGGDEDAPDVAERIEAGDTFPLELLGACRVAAPGEGLPPAVWAAAREAAAERARAANPTPDARVRELVADREAARARRDYAAADALRDRLAELGWEVQDTPDGPRLRPLG